MSIDPTSKNIRNTATLQEEVEKLTALTVPMHMPGHKRALMPSDCLPYEWDITEISGADDLHDADGILRYAMARADCSRRSGRQLRSAVRSLQPATATDQCSMR